MKNPLLVWDESGYGENVHQGGSYSRNSRSTRVSSRSGLYASRLRYQSFRLFRTQEKS